MEKVIDLTAIPNSPSSIEGIVNIRNKIIPVINTREKINMPKKEYDQDTRIIVVEMYEKTVGFIVDEVNEVLRISKDITEPPPEIVTASFD